MPLLDQPHGGLNIVVSRTSQHAGSWIRAVNTTGGLCHGSLRAEVQDDRREVTGAHLGRSQFQIIKRHVHAGLTINFQRFTGNQLHEILQWRKRKIQLK